jgi:hypothetical protein
MNPLSQALEQHNITPEDLEKAAGVRIFQKVAAAEGIDLAQLSDAQIEELFAHFEASVLPEIVGGEPSTEAKVASLSQEEVFDLFDKQAAAEGLDLSDASEEQLVAALGYFMENVLPAMAENGFEPVGAEKSAEAEEAQAKLAEADILGRQMARGYMDEIGKIAGAGDAAKALLSRGAAAVRQGGHLLSGKKLQGAGAAALGAGTAALGAGGAALGAKKLMGSKKEAGAPAPAISLSAEDVEILQQLSESGDLAGLQKAAGIIKNAAAAQIGSAKPGIGERIRGAASRGVALARAHPRAAAGIAVGGAAATGGAAALAHRMKSKSTEKDASAALDVLVEERAAELASGWLTDNGYGS